MGWCLLFEVCELIDHKGERARESQGAEAGEAGGERGRKAGEERERHAPTRFNSSHRRGAEPTTTSDNDSRVSTTSTSPLVTRTLAHSIGFYSILIPLWHSTSLSTNVVVMDTGA